MDIQLNKHFDFSEKEKAIEYWDEVKYKYNKVYVILSKHEYSSGYWIEVGEIPILSNQDTIVFDNTNIYRSKKIEDILND